eukprot:10787070-Karenia_brevis.AAC.1
MASLSGAHRAPPLQNSCSMLCVNRHMTLRYLRHLLEDTSVHMLPHSELLLMISAALAGNMSNGCYKHKETPVPSCCRD